VPRVLFGVTVPITANAFLRGQLALLVEQGWDVHLATSPDDGFERLREISGVTLHALPMKRQPAPFADAFSLVRWLRLVRKLRPDVVVSSTPKAGLLGVVSSRIACTAVRIYHIRGLRAEGLTGLMRKVSLTMERISCGWATTVLCDSHSLRDQMRTLGLLLSDQGVVLGAGSACGVDIQRFHPPTREERLEQRSLLQLTDDEVVIGFVGRITADKGVAELIRATEIVHDRWPNARLVLIGPIEDSTFSSLCESWITHIDFIDNPAPFYWAFDLFSLPSYREGFPIAVLEAMASGLPIVTTNAVGCLDSVIPGVTGCTVDVRAVEQLAEQLGSYVADAVLRSRNGANARIWAVADFDAIVVGERLANFLAAQLRATLLGL
jgi:glycosyltransferase involved in cell wall biosynthesis